MGIKKIVTKDRNYVIIVSVQDMHNVYFAYETFNQDGIEPLIDLSAEQFHVACKVEDHTHQVELSIDWDGCCDMNSMADGVKTHFCEMSNIDSYYGMITTCYGDAQKTFDF